MVRQYLPMLASTADRPFSGSDWLFEIKWDGVRAIAYIHGTPALISRSGNDLAAQFPELAELSRLAPETVLDGEIVTMLEGRPDIQSLLPRLRARGGPLAGAAPVTYIVFDILEKDGKPLIDLPFVERRRILKNSVREGPHVVISEPVEEKGEEYYRAAVAQELEGVMAKKKDSVYEPGIRSTSWLKIRADKTCDCIIAGYTKGRGGRSPVFGALLLALYDAENQLVYMGKVGSGFSDRDLADLTELFSHSVTTTPHLAGISGEGPVTWLEPVLVCEVAYQQVTRERRLRIPRFRRLRTDKRPEDCRTDQLEVRTVPVPKTQISATKRGTTGKSGRGLRAGTEQSITSHPAQPTERYHEKRNFGTTPEPEGVIAMPDLTFVIQEHHAHHLHFDFRLERDGVLKSWAVPKGVPEAPGAKHLAVMVEDHPLDYAKFEGTIPEGEYGAGTVTIWDSGTYETKHWDDKKIEVVLHGKRLSGHYVLVRFMRAGKNEWLVFKAGS